MKKLKILILLLLIPIILCSCNKKEYNLIQITGEELVENIFSEEKNFVFAIVDESEPNAEQFLKDLKAVVKSANINIYYVDYLHLDQTSGFELFSYFTTDFTTNGYHVIQNKSLTISNAYIDFKTMYTTLKEKSFTDKLVRIDNKTKKQYTKEAQKLYKENRVAEAYELLSKAWDLKEAKEEFKNNKYYNLITGWERTEITTDIPEKTNYTSLIFHSGVQFFTYQKITELSSEFEKPTDTSNSERYYYRIKDDVIYTSNREKGHYEETYKINDINDKYLYITDLKTGKKINFIKRGNL